MMLFCKTFFVLNVVGEKSYVFCFCSFQENKRIKSCVYIYTVSKIMHDCSSMAVTCYLCCY